jgi:membrane fusion protein (multidrug efflux system)
MLAWLLASVLMAGWLAWFVLGKVTVYEISRQARLEVQQAPHALASLIARRVLSTTLVIGQEVRAGDVLVELDASSEKLRLKEEETRLAAIPPKVKSLKTEIALMEQAKSEDVRSAIASIDSARYRTNEATAAVDFAKVNERRLREESENGGVAKVEALRALAETQKLSASRDALSSDVRKLSSDVQTRAHQQQAHIENLRRTVVSLEGEEVTVRATIERLKVDINNHSLRAPVSGRVGEVVPIRAGGYVAEGQKLATIVPSGELVILADFNPATALGRVRSGQNARMRLDGFPWTQYGTVSAKVSRVASEIRDGMVRVELTVESTTVARTLMQHGLLGAVEVSVEQTSPAILVLRAAGQMLSSAPPQPPQPKATSAAAERNP